MEINRLLIIESYYELIVFKNSLMIHIQPILLPIKSEIKKLMILIIKYKTILVDILNSKLKLKIK